MKTHSLIHCTRVQCVNLGHVVGFVGNEAAPLLMVATTPHGGNGHVIHSGQQIGLAWASYGIMKLSPT